MMATCSPGEVMPYLAKALLSAGAALVASVHSAGKSVPEQDAVAGAMAISWSAVKPGWETGAERAPRAKVVARMVDLMYIFICCSDDCMVVGFLVGSRSLCMVVCSLCDRYA